MERESRPVQEAEIARAADYFARGRLGPVKMAAPEGENRPAGEMEAYAVQSAVHRVLSDAGRGRLIGWKIGCTTPVMQKYLGIPNPCSGGIFQPTVHYREGTIEHSDFLNPGVECELAVYIGEDVPAMEDRYTATSISYAVQALFPAIEIVDDRWEDYTRVDTPSLIADDFFGAGCVLGDPVANWHNINLEALRGEMRINGRMVGEGVGADIMGHPFEALAWLANSLGRRGQSLKQGEIVMLGSLVQTNWVGHMDEVVIEVDGLGTASAWFG